MGTSARPRCTDRAKAEHAVTLLHLLAINQPEDPMNEESLNLSIRKFLKMVGVSSQRDIEQAVAAAIASGALAGTETLPATMTLEIAALKVKVTFDGSIALQ